SLPGWAGATWRAISSAGLRRSLGGVMHRLLQLWVHLGAQDTDHAPPVGLLHLETHAAEHDVLARLRDVPQLVDHEAGQGVVVAVLVELEAKGRPYVLQVGRAEQTVGAVVEHGD